MAPCLIGVPLSLTTLFNRMYSHLSGKIKFLVIHILDECTFLIEKRNRADTIYNILLVPFKESSDGIAFVTMKMIIAASIMETIIPSVNFEQEDSLEQSFCENVFDFVSVFLTCC